MASSSTDVMPETIHPDATPMRIEGGKFVGWQMITNGFELHAVIQADGTINSYVNWGDDQGGDLANHEDWKDVKRWLDTLLQASRR
jgi:hypothetical protein